MNDTQHGQIECRAAIEASIKMLIDRFETARCDCDGVSGCVRCNVVFLAKSVREMLSKSVQSAARESCEHPTKAFQVADMEGKPLYVPLCAGHAQTWFTERDHLAGGMDAECIVCAHKPASSTAA